MIEVKQLYDHTKFLREDVKKKYKQNNIINCLLEYLAWRENFIICNKNERLHTAQSNILFCE